MAIFDKEVLIERWAFFMRKVTINMKVMEVLVTKFKSWKTHNNAGEMAKFYVTHMKGNTGHEAIKIVKLTLTNHRIKSPEFILIKKYKRTYLYREMIDLKPETLLRIAIMIRNFNWTPSDENTGTNTIKD